MSNNRYNMAQIIPDKFKTKLLYVTSAKYEGRWHSTLHSHHFTELFYVIQERVSLAQPALLTIYKNKPIVTYISLWVYLFMNNYLAESSLSRIYKPFQCPAILSSLSTSTPNVSSSSICSSTNHARRFITLWSASSLASSTKA